MKKIFLICLSIVFLAGCASTTAYKFSNKFSNLKLGLSKTEVKDILGPPEYFRSATMNNDKYQEVWQYTSYAIPHGELIAKTVTYWLVFEDEKLIFYGFPGDFGTTGPDHKQEVIIKER